MTKFSIGGGDRGAGSSGGREKRRRVSPQTPAATSGAGTSGAGGGGERAETENRQRVGGGGGGGGERRPRAFRFADGDAYCDNGVPMPFRLSSVDSMPAVSPPIESAEEEEDEEEEEDDSDGEDEEEEEEEEEDEEEEEEEELEQPPVEEQGVQQEQRAAPSPDKSATFTLTDTDVLDCAICFEPLRSPIFQCENGHIACSSCCTKMANRCPSCSMPIGYNRCRALEKVLECVQLTCKFSNYGCNETISYHKRQDHEKFCLHVPCHCPLTHCSYIGSSKQLSQHFSLDHPGSGTRFRFNSSKSLCLRFDTRFHVLQEESEDMLFLLTNMTDPLGNKMTISCIGPSSKGDYLYDLVAKYENSYLKFQTFTGSIQEPKSEPQLSPFLMIPQGFFRSAVTMKLEFLIRDYRTRS